MARAKALFGDDFDHSNRGQPISALPWPAFLLDARRHRGADAPRLPF